MHKIYGSYFINIALKRTASFAKQDMDHRCNHVLLFPFKENVYIVIHINETRNHYWDTYYL